MLKGKKRFFLLKTAPVIFLLLHLVSTIYAEAFFTLC